jgi:NlpC/P60 family
MRFFLTHLLTAVGISVAVTSCNNSQKLAKRINASVVLSADTVKKALPVKPVNDTIKQQYHSLQIEFGDLLSVPYDSIYNFKLYSFIKENLGKKCFSSKKLNYDCDSFLSTLFNEVYGITIPATADEQMKYKNFDLFKNTRYLKPGDVLFFNNSPKRPDKIIHAGFYLYNSFFVVVTANEGIVIRKTGAPYWIKHFVAAGRMNKLATQNN